MMTVTRIAVSDFRSIAEEWDAFLEASTNNTIFLTYEWLISWWDAFGTESRSFYFLVVRNTANGIVGAFPLQVVTLRVGLCLPLKLLVFLGRGWHDSKVVDYTTFMMPPVLPGFESQVYGAVAAYLVVHGDEWDLCALANLLSRHPTTPILESELKTRFKTKRLKQEDNYVINLSATYEDFLKSLSQNQRRQLTMRAKRIQKDYDAKFTLITREDQIEDYLRDYYLLVNERHQWKPNRSQEVFMGHLCRNLARRGWLRSYLLVLNGAPAVTQFGFAYGRKYYLYKAAFSPTFAASSPGTALSAFALRNEIEQGSTEFDFLVGYYDYKQYWSNEVRDMDYLMVFSQRVVSRVKTGVLLLLMQFVRVIGAIATRLRRTVVGRAPRPQKPVE